MHPTCHSRSKPIKPCTHSSCCPWSLARGLFAAFQEREEGFLEQEFPVCPLCPAFPTQPRAEGFCLMLQESSWENCLERCSCIQLIPLCPPLPSQRAGSPARGISPQAMQNLRDNSRPSDMHLLMLRPKKVPAQDGVFCSKQSGENGISVVCVVFSMGKAPISDSLG